MIKRLLSIFLFTFIAFSCAKQNSTVKIQLVRVGGAACHQVNELNKGYGAEYFVDYNLGEDSLFVYTCRINPVTGEPEPEAGYELYVNDDLKKMFQDIKFASDTIRSGVLSSLPRPSEGEAVLYHGGVYVLKVVTDDNTKYYSFIIRNTTPFEMIVNSFNQTLMLVNSNTNKQSLVKFNVDSTISSLMGLPGLDSMVFPPPLKTNLRFTPPEIRENG
jgi:hypothetical protein